MSDLEAVEAAIRRVLSHVSIQPHETGVEGVLQLLADELAEMNRPRKLAREWGDAQTKKEVG